MTIENDPLEPIEESSSGPDVTDETTATDVVEDATLEAEDIIDPDSEEAFEVADEAEAAGLEISKPAAVTINIASWATPIVGVVMLIFGLAGGYFLRPVLTEDPNPTPVAVSEQNTNPEAAPSNVQPPVNEQQQQAPQADPADREALMAALLPEVRHFKGNPDAPITLIEFSDFQ